MDSPLAATSTENLPATQASQATLPSTSLNVPATHATHASPLAPEYPLLHMHWVALALAAGDSALLGQLVQVPLPRLTLNLPAAQSTHACPSGPVYPALQMHSLTALLAAGEFVLAGHAFRHGALPNTSLKVPAGHSEQTPPLGPV